MGKKDDREKTEQPDHYVRELMRELAALKDLTAVELADKIEQITGHRPRSTNNPIQLRRQAAQALQRHHYGSDLKTESFLKIESIAASGVFPVEWRARVDRLNGQPSTKPDRDPRLPPIGTSITCLHNGIVHTVKILEKGFEYNGQVYRSLTAIAEIITGGHTNGFALFKLGKKNGSARKQAKGGKP